MRGIPFLAALVACSQGTPGTPCNEDSDCGRDVCQLGFCRAFELPRAPALDQDTPTSPPPLPADGCAVGLAELDGNHIDPSWDVVSENGARVIADGAIRVQLDRSSEFATGYVRSVAPIVIDDHAITVSVLDVPAGSVPAFAFLGLYGVDGGSMEVGINQASFTVRSDDDGRNEERRGESALRIRTGGGFAAIEATADGVAYRVLHRAPLRSASAFAALGAYTVGGLTENATSAFGGARISSGCGCDVRFYDSFDEPTDQWDFAGAEGAAVELGALRLTTMPNLADPQADAVGYLFGDNSQDFFGRRIEAVVREARLGGDGFAAALIYDGSDRFAAVAFNQEDAAVQTERDVVAAVGFELARQRRIAIEVGADDVRFSLGVEDGGLEQIGALPVRGFERNAFILLFVQAPTPGGASIGFEELRVVSSVCP